MGGSSLTRAAKRFRDSLYAPQDEVRVLEKKTKKGPKPRVIREPQVTKLDLAIMFAEAKVRKKKIPINLELANKLGYSQSALERARTVAPAVLPDPGRPPLLPESLRRAFFDVVKTRQGYSDEEVHSGIRKLHYARYIHLAKGQQDRDRLRKAYKQLSTSIIQKYMRIDNLVHRMGQSAQSVARANTAADPRTFISAYICFMVPFIIVAF
jgi:hypothetical protein